ncbi:choice-of-anchor tandem repeat GloVer-containing protein [Methylocystis heyeri]|uniref:Uncharacterized protein n=1 Tax=Methylocystis heyeri TaxID=391905 RepID=A0A6B8KCD2_9HYPH|nr:choice-of-anchor tandem repeat GloVer-containing protein [Methylocystis heyeri]QGM44685.1 hypothetical protein H2LOC_002710 [Methylocystis heyeri]
MSILKAARFALAAALSLSAPFASAQQLRPEASSHFGVAPLHSFSGGADGGGKILNLAVDSDGALYGTTSGGGASNLGVVFKLTPPEPGKSKWTETILYTFSGADGAIPIFTPTINSQGALYGATTSGGSGNYGVAFKLTPPAPPATQWVETKMVDFNFSIGENPQGAFVMDSSGALYGGAYSGGASYRGTVYKLTPPGSGVALYNFTGGADGGQPGLTFAMDANHALYGAAGIGGANRYGVVFKLTPPGANCTPTAPNLWCETVLYNFAGGADGGSPVGVIMDAHGALYGATFLGGAGGYGQVFKLTPPTAPATQWTKTELYSFTGGADGANPYSAPVLLGGALYGAVPYGGGCSLDPNCGSIYRLNPPVPPSTQWTEETLWTFTGGMDGARPYAGLTIVPVNFGLGVYGATASQVFALQCLPRAREVLGGALQTACAR